MSQLFRLLTFIALLALMPGFTHAVEAKDLELHKQELLKLGLPADEFVLNYLAVELFYNVPGLRPVVAKAREMRVIDVTVPFLSPLARVLRGHFGGPRTVEEGHLKAIRISGHSSWFVWSPSDPDLYFILKPEYGVSETEAVTQVFSEAVKRLEMPDFDFTEELAVENSHSKDRKKGTDLNGEDFEGIVRPLKSHRWRAGEQIYPLHGFIGASMLSSLAATRHKSLLEFLRTEFMPKLADSIFDSVYLTGIWPSAHTQNLWIALGQNGEFRFVHKDYSTVVIDHLVRHTQSSYPENFGEYLFAGEGGIMEVNTSVKLEESNRLIEPGFIFAGLIYQSIARCAELNKGELILRSFLERFIQRVEAQFPGLQLKFSPRVQTALERLDTNPSSATADFTIWWGDTTFETARGPVAFAENIISEINTQVYAHLIGPRTYPRAQSEQRRLKGLFDDAPFFYPLALRSWPRLPLITTWPAKAFSFLQLPYHLVRSVRNGLEPYMNHFEETPDYVLIVSRRGEVLNAVRKVRERNTSICELQLLRANEN